MNITFLAHGFRGDVQPFIPLADGLQKAGHRVLFAAPTNFRPLVTEHGLEFFDLGVDAEAFVQQPATQKWLKTGNNPVAYLRQAARVMLPFMEDVTETSLEACRGADAVIFSPASFNGYLIAEKLKIKAVGAFLQPVIYPASGYPFPIASLASAAAWMMVKPSMQRIRRRLDMPADSNKNIFAKMKAERMPMLHGYSTQIVPRPDSWPEWARTGGYWFLDAHKEWRPPPALERFLSAGEKPVYIGFGSMSVDDPEGVQTAITRAISMTGARAVVAAGWSGLSGEAASSDRIFSVASAPHDWLFPRVAATVHHVGAGTTAASMRAGTPQVPVPFFGDQPFWAKRATALGVAAKPIPCERLTAERLARGIDQALRPACISRAAETGQRLRAEDGVAHAVRDFHQLIASASPPQPL